MTTFHFKGSGTEYFKIWIVNILLTVVTLGLYYPWAKVRTLRYFYGNSLLDDRRFDYHATGKQLFVSHAIAMALLITYVILQKVSPFLNVILFLGLFLGMPWILWRSMMFHLRMTSFSQVRFSFDGTLGKAYLNFLALPFLLMLLSYGILISSVVFIVLSFQNENAFSISTLIGIIAFLLGMGLTVVLLAVIKKRNAQYLINGSRFGQGRFTANLKTNVFVTIWFKTIGLGILATCIFGLALSVLWTFTIEFDSVFAMGYSHEPSVLLIIASYISMMVLVFLIAAYAHTRQRNYVVNHTLLDDKIRLHSSLKARTFAWISVSNLLMIVFTFGLAIPFTRVRMTQYILANTHVDAQSGFDEYLTQHSTQQSALGDQLGDAFDVNVGLPL